MHWPGHRCTCPSDKVLLRICHARGGGGEGDVRAYRFPYPAPTSRTFVSYLSPFFVLLLLLLLLMFLHFPPTSPPLRTLASLPFLSRLPYLSRPLFYRVPTPLTPSTRLLSLVGGVTVWRFNLILTFNDSHSALDKSFSSDDMRNFNS